MYKLACVALTLSLVGCVPPFEEERLNGRYALDARVEIHPHGYKGTVAPIAVKHQWPVVLVGRPQYLIQLDYVHITMAPEIELLKMRCRRRSPSWDTCSQFVRVPLNGNAECRLDVFWLMETYRLHCEFQDQTYLYTFER